MACYQAWSYWHGLQVEKSSRELEAVGELLRSPGNEKASADRLAELAAEGGGAYPVLAKLQEAAQRAQGGDVKAALVLYDSVAKTERSSLFRDFAVVRAGVFLVELLRLFMFSALYQALRGRAKNVLRKLDHCAIYLLIAGSYTPFALVTLRGAWGWSLFGVTWALALLGIAQELWLARGARVGSLVIYLLMGWSALVAVVPLLAALTPAGLAGLLAGGLCYTAGIYFYVHDERLRHGHGIWHLFVLAGAICHFLTVAIFVA